MIKPVPCGGCEEDRPERVCIGCRHVFWADPKDAEISRLHGFILVLAGKLADASEVIGKNAERKRSPECGSTTS